MNFAYRQYWERKRMLAQTVPHFPVVRWWKTEALCEIEEVYFSAIRNAKSVLDIGAGDLRIMRKLQKAGFAGEYHTQDVSDEYTHTYQAISEIRRTYEAILCLDVLEHLGLEDGLELLCQLVELLNENGVLVLQTPNARCVNNPMSWDMTHIHLYNLNDLWAYLSAVGLQVKGYRVFFTQAIPSPLTYVRSFAARVVATQFLGMDYAHNIAIVARRIST